MSPKPVEQENGDEVNTFLPDNIKLVTNIVFQSFKAFYLDDFNKLIYSTLSWEKRLKTPKQEVKYIHIIKANCDKLINKTRRGLPVQVTIQPKHTQQTRRQLQWCIQWHLV